MSGLLSTAVPSHAKGAFNGNQRILIKVNSMFYD